MRITKFKQRKKEAIKNTTSFYHSLRVPEKGEPRTENNTHIAINQCSNPNNPETI